MSVISLLYTKSEVVQEDGFGLEHLIAAGEAQQGRERVAGREESDDEDGQDCLAELELWIFRVQSRKYQVSGAHISLPIRASAVRGCCLPSQYHPGRGQCYEPPVPGRGLAIPLQAMEIDVRFVLGPKRHWGVGVEIHSTARRESGRLLQLCATSGHGGPLMQRRALCLANECRALRLQVYGSSAQGGVVESVQLQFSLTRVPRTTDRFGTSRCQGSVCGQGQRAASKQRREQAEQREEHDNSGSGPAAIKSVDVLASAGDAGRDTQGRAVD